MAKAKADGEIAYLLAAESPPEQDASWFAIEVWAVGGLSRVYRVRRSSAAHTLGAHAPMNLDDWKKQKRDTVNVVRCWSEPVEPHLLPAELTEWATSKSGKPPAKKSKAPAQDAVAFVATAPTSGLVPVARGETARLPGTQRPRPAVLRELRSARKLWATARDEEEAAGERVKAATGASKEAGEHLARLVAGLDEESDTHEVARALKADDQAAELVEKAKADSGRAKLAAHAAWRKLRGLLREMVEVQS